MDGKVAYTVLKNLHLDHQEYTLGDEVELTEKQAKELAAYGVVDLSEHDFEAK
ncbi:MAG TPA: hypothetical protein PKY05_03330 [Fibrobacteria bacterium]|nr:hypothetical protein [Fibrobacteria bacterium]